MKILNEVVYMFSLSNDTREYIKENGSNVLVTMPFMTSASGWCPSKSKLRGNYVPRVFLDSPNEDEKMNLLKEEQDGITIWYEQMIADKRTSDTITIEKKGLFFLKWLALDGVPTIPVAG